jgi:hypothetical protein
MLLLSVLTCGLCSSNCGQGPYPISLESKSFTVYQVANREVVLSNNVSAESHTFRWRVNKGKSKLNHSQLNTLSRRHIVQKTVSGVRSLHINLTLELDGLAAGFQFQRVKDGQLTTTPSNWVVLKVSTPVKISLGQNSIYTAQNGQNISICANISGNPLPQATVVWKQTEAMLNESLHRYDGNCWTLDKSVVKKGGNFMIVARNCLDRTNASFSIIGEGKTVSSTAHPGLYLPACPSVCLSKMFYNVLSCQRSIHTMALRSRVIQIQPIVHINVLRIASDRICSCLFSFILVSFLFSHSASILYISLLFICCTYVK